MTPWLVEDLWVTMRSPDWHRPEAKPQVDVAAKLLGTVVLRITANLEMPPPRWRGVPALAALTVDR